MASRGLDIRDITYVFNFDFPRNIEEYVHRVGRTGRAGKKGQAISLMEKRGGDWKHAKGKSRYPVLVKLTGDHYGQAAVSDALTVVEH